MLAGDGPHLLVPSHDDVNDNHFANDGSQGILAKFMMANLRII